MMHKYESIPVQISLIFGMNKLSLQEFYKNTRGKKSDFKNFKKKINPSTLRSSRNLRP